MTKPSSFFARRVVSKNYYPQITQITQMFFRSAVFRVYPRLIPFGLPGPSEQLSFHPGS